MRVGLLERHAAMVRRRRPTLHNVMLTNRKGHQPVFSNWLASVPNSGTILSAPCPDFDPRMNASTLVQKLWNYCNVLRDDGMSYGDYVEQFTYLLFLKMADERTKPPYNQPSHHSRRRTVWPSLLKQGRRRAVRSLPPLARRAGQASKGMLGLIFTQGAEQVPGPGQAAPADRGSDRQRKLVGDERRREGRCLRGLAGEERAGHQDRRRPVLHAASADPGDGGRASPPSPARRSATRPAAPAAFCSPPTTTSLKHNPNLDQATEKRQLKQERVQGLGIGARHGAAVRDEPVAARHRLATKTVPDRWWPTALAADPGERFDIVLTNPPFGKKSSTTIVGEEGKSPSETRRHRARRLLGHRPRNKQLNFVQHVKTLLKINGRAAVVVPDNVLFEGGAGETIRRKLLHECDVHTLLRLPTGLFYAQGVKANVLFFDKKPASETPWTKKLWIYDLRTNKHFTLKTDPLKREDLDEFVQLYNPANRHDRTADLDRPTKPDGRWRAYDYDELMARDKASLDIFWLRDETLDDSDNLPPPDMIAQEIVDDLEAALEQFRLIAADLGAEAGE